jgi:hypothetical protein
MTLKMNRINYRNQYILYSQAILEFLLECEAPCGKKPEILIYSE